MDWKTEAPCRLGRWWPCCAGDGCPAEAIPQSHQGPSLTGLVANVKTDGFAF